jgi:hypothetical protein
LDSAGRAERVKKIRGVLGKKIQPKTYEKLNEGTIAKAYKQKAKREISAKSKGDVDSVAYLEYKLKLLDTNEMVGHASTAELLSEALGINIIVLDARGEPIMPLYGKRTCESLKEDYFIYPKTVIVSTKDNIGYTTVGRLVKSAHGDILHCVFDTSSEFIQAIIDACGS